MKTASVIKTMIEPVYVVQKETRTCHHSVSHTENAWAFFRSIGSPKYWVAPMVDQSELPFRMLCRKYGATGAYTPMLHARIFSECEKYRFCVKRTFMNDSDLTQERRVHDL